MKCVILLALIFARLLPACAVAAPNDPSQSNGSDGLDVRAFGAKLDGSTDDGPAVQACLNAATKGICLIPIPTTIAMATAVTVANGAMLLGVGHAGEHDIRPGYTSGCTIKWTGASSATMFTFKPASAGPAAPRNEQGGIEGCGLDGNNDAAAIGVLLQSTYFADVDIFGQHFSTAVFKSVPVADSPGIGEDSDVQHADVSVIFNQSGPADGNGLIIDGTPLHNTSLVHFKRIMGYYNNADGVVIGNADNDDFDPITLYQSAGGSATAGVRCKASNAALSQTCRYNRFTAFSILSRTGYGVVLEGTDTATYPSTNNILGVIDDSNGTTYGFGVRACADFIKNLTLFHNICGQTNITGELDNSGVAKLANNQLMLDGQHVRWSSNSPTVSGCGSGCVLDDQASDTAGTITNGASSTGGMLTFGTNYSHTPHCAVSSQSSGNNFSYGVTSSTISWWQTATSNNKIDYTCSAGGGG